jgi:hypothetical protein
MVFLSLDRLSARSELDLEAAKGSRGIFPVHQASELKQFAFLE